MKSSELMQKLAILIETHGDREILIEVSGFNAEEILSINSIYETNMYLDEEECEGNNIDTTKFKLDEDNQIYMLSTSRVCIQG